MYKKSEKQQPLLENQQKLVDLHNYIGFLTSIPRRINNFVHNPITKLS